MVPPETCVFGALCLILTNSITWAAHVGLDPIDNDVFHLQNTTQTSFSVEASKRHLNK